MFRSSSSSVKTLRQGMMANLKHWTWAARGTASREKVRVGWPNLARWPYDTDDTSALTSLAGLLAGTRTEHQKGSQRGNRHLAGVSSHLRRAFSCLDAEPCSKHRWQDALCHFVGHFTLRVFFSFMCCTFPPAWHIVQVARVKDLLLDVWLKTAQREARHCCVPRTCTLRACGVSHFHSDGKNVKLTGLNGPDHDSSEDLESIRAFRGHPSKVASILLGCTTSFCKKDTHSTCSTSAAPTTRS